MVRLLVLLMKASTTYLLLPLGKRGSKWGDFHLGNGVCLIMKKAPSDSPIWQLKKRELLQQYLELGTLEQCNI